MRKALARIIALVAIAACGVAIYAVVHSNLLRHHHTTTTATTPPSPTTTHHHAHTPYTIKKGDVLSKIALAHHVTVAQIEKLNPKLVPGELHAGEKIQLR
jgi:LysM repeat protein